MNNSSRNDCLVKVLTLAFFKDFFCNKKIAQTKEHYLSETSLIGIYVNYHL